jgi:hypothetical protein
MLNILQIALSLQNISIKHNIKINVYFWQPGLQKGDNLNKSNTPVIHSPRKSSNLESRAYHLHYCCAQQNYLLSNILRFAHKLLFNFMFSKSTFWKHCLGKYLIFFLICSVFRGRDRIMIVGFTTTCAISPYHY